MPMQKRNARLLTNANRMLDSELNVLSQTLYRCPVCRIADASFSAPFDEERTMKAEARAAAKERALNLNNASNPAAGHKADNGPDSARSTATESSQAAANDMSAE